MIDKRARIIGFLRHLYHAKASSRVWLSIVLILVLFDVSVSAQNDMEGDIDEERSFEEESAEPSSTIAESDETVLSEAATIDQNDATRSDLALSEFLFAIRVGPFFSLGLWTGLFGEIEFEFKLHDHGYLSLLTSFNGGYQIDFERGDFLLSEALGYRRYIPSSPDGLWTFFGGVSFGYFTTTQGQAERSYDWLHVGGKVNGGYYFLTSETMAVGIDIGLSLAYQLAEVVDADDFLVFIPNVSATLLF